MSDETQMKLAKKSLNKFMVTVITLLITMALAWLLSVLYTVVMSDKIYSGVIVGGLYAGGKTKNDLQTELMNKYGTSPEYKIIKLRAKDNFESFNYKQAKVQYDITKAVDAAYDFGRTGTFFYRFFSVALSRGSDYIIDIKYTYDKNFTTGMADSLARKSLIKVQEHDVTFTPDDKAILTMGHTGESINEEYALSVIDEYIKNFKDGEINLQIIKNSPKALNSDELFKKLNTDPQDSRAEVVDNKLKIIPPVSGRKISKNEVDLIIARVKGLEDHQEPLPVVFIEASLKALDISKRLFTSTLASFSTQFYTGDRNNDNRKNNITIAASKINGKLLGAKEVFSFNDTVGPRTPQNGYKDAHAYVGGKIVDSTGGGICQVSTTLYNAVLYADLDVLERNNHMFTVGYVPKGRDAAVSYGTADLKFKNSTKWPIKIFCWVSDDNKIHFSLSGTNDTPQKSVDFRYVVQKELAPKVDTIYEPNMLEGTSEVVNEAMTGYIVDTFKTTKQNGAFVKEEKIHTSRYEALAKQIKVGTKKQTQQVTASITPATTSTPTPVTKGVDDAYNPPVKTGE